MTRVRHVNLVLLIAGLLFLLTASLPFVTTATAQGQNNAKKQGEESTRDAPPDVTPYRRLTVPEDYAPKGMRPIPVIPSTFIVDTVVNNTDPNLTNTDTFNDGETSITVNPVNPNEIVITAFSGSWGANAPLWHSTDGGNIWTKQFTIPAPPGIAATGCPCDQTIDYGMANQMSGTFLISDIFSGITTNPASPPAWNWLVIGGVTQTTNFNNSPSPEIVDQPWLLVNTDPMIQPRKMCTTPTTTLLTEIIAAEMPATSAYLSPSASIRLISQLITNPEQRRVASTQVTGLPSTHGTAPSTAYSSGISVQGLEDRKTSTICSTVARTAEPRGP